ncbi:CRISPR-associated endoribonuclease Cas6 [Clostridium carnis]
MRFTVKGEIKDKKMPLSYRTMIMSIIKKAIELGDKEYFNELYYYENKKSKKIKPFCFAVYLRNFKVCGDMVEVNGEISITISTPDYNLGIVVYNGFLKMKEHNYNGIIFSKNKITLEKECKVSESEVIFKTLSPIYIKNKENKSIDIDDSEYSKELNYICNLLLNSYRGYGLNKELKFTSLNMKKIVVKEKIKDFVKNSNKDFMYINAYAGVFKLEGDVEDLNLLKQLGVGFRRSEGFGLIDII